MKVIDSSQQQVEKPDDIVLGTDLKNGVPYLAGRCTICREHFILKFTGAHKYECPKCKKEFIIRRNR
jgi:hypothetical protein